jgi:hypothetical protein
LLRTDSLIIPVEKTNIGMSQAGSSYQQEDPVSGESASSQVQVEIGKGQFPLTDNPVEAQNEVGVQDDGVEVAGVAGLDTRDLEPDRSRVEPVHLPKQQAGGTLVSRRLTHQIVRDAKNGSRVHFDLHAGPGQAPAMHVALVQLHGDLGDLALDNERRARITVAKYGVGV